LPIYATAALLFVHELIVNDFGASDYLNILWILSLAVIHLASQAQVRIATGRSMVANELLQVRKWRIEALIPGLLLLALVAAAIRSEEHTSELQSRENLVCRLLLEKKKKFYFIIVL